MWNNQEKLCHQNQLTHMEMSVIYLHVHCAPLQMETQAWCGDRDVHMHAQFYAVMVKGSKIPVLILFLEIVNESVLYTHN